MTKAEQQRVERISKNMIQLERNFEIFKAIINGEKIKKIAETYNMSSAGVNAVFKKVIRDIRGYLISHEKYSDENLKADFPYDKFPDCYYSTGEILVWMVFDKKVIARKPKFAFEMYQRFLERVKMNYGLIPDLKAQAEKLNKEKKHRLTFLACEFKIFLAEQYKTILNNKDYNYQELLKSPIGIHLLKEMAMVAFELEANPLIGFAKIDENVYAPKICINTIIQTDKPKPLPDDRSLFDKFYELIKEVEKFYLVLP